MTARERLVAASRGGNVDRRPVIAWPGVSADSDALVVTPGEVSAARAENPDMAVLAEVPNPYWVVRRHNLREIFQNEPKAGDDLLSDATQVVQGQIDVAMANGADGILYRLHGATPGLATPMEYGGHYLDRDRALLESVESAAFNFIFVVGEQGTYLDFVSDLPAHAFGWDVARTGVPVSEIRTMRVGAIAADSDEADIQLRSMVENITGYLEAQTVAGV